LILKFGSQDFVPFVSPPGLSRLLFGYRPPARCRRPFFTRDLPTSLLHFPFLSIQAHPLHFLFLGQSHHGVLTLHCMVTRRPLARQVVRRQAQVLSTPFEILAFPRNSPKSFPFLPSFLFFSAFPLGLAYSDLFFFPSVPLPSSLLL